MSQLKVRAYICLDEHGNYQIIGGSSVNDLNKNQAIAIIEDGIKVDGVNSVTTSFQVNIELPTQTPIGENNEVNNVSE
jgi:hypothetical protein